MFTIFFLSLFEQWSDPVAVMWILICVMGNLLDPDPQKKMRNRIQEEKSPQMCQASAEKKYVFINLSFKFPG